MSQTSQPAPADGGTVDDPTIITPSRVRQWSLPQSGQFEGKDSRGRVLVVGGSQSTPGAVLLGGVAALRVGAGKLQMATAETAATALAIAVPEAGVVGLPLDDSGALGAAAGREVASLAEGMAAVLVGLGMTGPEATRKMLEEALPGVPDEAGLVLDALALTCGALTPDVLQRFEGRVVITPNSAEMKRILDSLDDDGGDDEEGLALTSHVARTLGVVVAFEGSVAAPDGRCWTDGTGNPGLGTSGSGDVLAGVIVGLLARGADPAQAAVWGAHIHGQAGDRLSASVGRLGYLASELLAQVPHLLDSLED